MRLELGAEHHAEARICPESYHGIGCVSVVLAECAEWLAVCMPSDAEETVAQRTTKVSGSTKSTIDHDEIRRWVEKNGAHPAIVKGTNIVRVDFPGFSGEDSLDEISWEDFFDKFEESKLALIYQDQTKSGRASRFNKFVHRDSIRESGNGARGPARSSRARNTKAKKKATASENGKNRSGSDRPVTRTLTRRASRAGNQAGNARTVHRTTTGKKKRKGASTRARRRP
jgi:hypothetical protein